MLSLPFRMMLRTSSAKAGGPWLAIRAGSIVTATRLSGLDSSPMNHLFSQYAGHATPLAVSTSARWYTGPDITACPPPFRYGWVYVASSSTYVGMPLPSDRNG